MNQIALKNNYVAIDKDARQIVINLDTPSDITESWGITLNAPNTRVEMNLMSLSIKTQGDISFETPDDKYILLNTTREQYQRWLELEGHSKILESRREKLLKELSPGAKED